MKHNDRLQRMLLSKGMGWLYFLLIVLASTSGNRGWWIAAGVAFALHLGALLWVSIGPMRDSRRAWRDFPDTPEYEAYARKREPGAMAERARKTETIDGRS